MSIMNPFNIKELMQKAKEMQSQMKEAQQKLQSIVVVGTAGGGLVKAHVNGLHHTLRVEIADVLMRDDKDMLEDLIAAAFNDAANKIEDVIKQKMSELTKDIQLPENIDE